MEKTETETKSGLQEKQKQISKELLTVIKFLKNIKDVYILEIRLESY